MVHIVAGSTHFDIIIDDDKHTLELDAGMLIVVPPGMLASIPLRRWRHRARDHAPERRGAHVRRRSAIALEAARGLARGSRLMIIDSHAYCFAAADSLLGYDSIAEHLSWVQAGQAEHYQPVFSTRDPAPGLLDGARARGQRRSRPPSRCRPAHRPRGGARGLDDRRRGLHQALLSAQSAELRVHTRRADQRDGLRGRDLALLHTNPMLGRSSAYQAECVRRFPDRLRSMAPVDEWRIRDDAGAVIRELEQSIEKHGLHAIKFNPDGYRVSAEPWDDGFYRPFWEAATALGVPIFFSLGNGPSRHTWSTSRETIAAYLGELGILQRWMTRYPGTLCSITHGFPYRSFLEGDRIRLPEGVWAPFENPNLSIEVSFPVRIGDLFDFPYHEAIPAIEEMVERIGADRLLWGTDMPFQNRHCTYRQSRGPHRESTASSSAPRNSS